MNRVVIRSKLYGNDISPSKTGCTWAGKGLAGSWIMAVKETDVKWLRVVVNRCWCEEDLSTHREVRGTSPGRLGFEVNFVNSGIYMRSVPSSISHNTCCAKAARLHPGHSNRNEDRRSADDEDIVWKYWYIRSNMYVFLPSIDITRRSRINTTGEMGVAGAMFEWYVIGGPERIGQISCFRYRRAASEQLRWNRRPRIEATTRRDSGRLASISTSLAQIKSDRHRRWLSRWTIHHQRIDSSLSST